MEKGVGEASLGGGGGLRKETLNKQTNAVIRSGLKMIHEFGCVNSSNRKLTFTPLRISDNEKQ